MKLVIASLMLIMSIEPIPDPISSPVATTQYDCAAAQQRILQLNAFIQTKCVLVETTFQELNALQVEAQALTAAIIYYELQGLAAPYQWIQRLNWLLATGIPGKQNTLTVAQEQLAAFINEKQLLLTEMMANGC